METDNASQKSSNGNTDLVVNNSTLAETLGLKIKSSSAENLAAKRVRDVFRPDELVHKNCSGTRNKDKLDDEKLKNIISHME